MTEIRYTKARCLQRLGEKRSMPVPARVAGLSIRLLVASVPAMQRHKAARLILDIPWLAGFKSTQPVRFGVYQNLAFNMGAGGVMEFHHALADAQAGNWVQCAADMRASLWYTQVGARAERLCTQMETGVWQ